VGAVIAVTWRAFVTRPGGDGGHRGRRDRRDRSNGTPLGSAVAAVTTAVAELRPARTLIWWGEGLRCRRECHDSVTVVLVRTSRRGLRWPRHSTKMSNGREPRCRPWGPRRSRRQDRALEAAGDRNSKCFMIASPRPPPEPDADPDPGPQLSLGRLRHWPWKGCPFPTEERLDRVLGDVVRLVRVEGRAYRGAG
jgi:hypothetical protein